MTTYRRRTFLQSAAALAAFPVAGFSSTPAHKKGIAGGRFKLSLNAYSFNEPLLSGKTTLPQVMEFCAAQGFDAVDLTGYYFTGYPLSPTDDYIFGLKRKAHALGLAISGIGIRNNFSLPDKAAREKEVALAKRWIDVAAKVGAPVIRLYSGSSAPQGYTWEAVAHWMLEDIKTCVAYGKEHGVIVAVQNHNDFIKTAEQALHFIKEVNSEWFGLVGDTGNFIQNEPYGEIAKIAPYTVNWQIKEKLTVNGKAEDMDLVKLFSIIKASPYRGYLPIETLSPGDPFVIIPPFLKAVRAAMDTVMNA